MKTQQRLSGAASVPWVSCPSSGPISDVPRIAVARHENPHNRTYRGYVAGTLSPRILRPDSTLHKQEIKLIWLLAFSSSSATWDDCALPPHAHCFNRSPNLFFIKRQPATPTLLSRALIFTLSIQKAHGVKSN